MKETEQTLFLKSNLPHIRLKEGEYEVSNPQLAMYGTAGNAVVWKPDVTDNCEWPYGVELIKRYKLREGWSDEPTARDTVGTVFARLLPKEEKRTLFDGLMDADLGRP